MFGEFSERNSLHETTVIKRRVVKDWDDNLLTNGLFI